MLEKRGVDAIIAQGTEAGGHRGTFTGVDITMQPGLFALLPQVVDAVKVPVIAAGGVADGRTVAAAFVLGASAVQLGTAFLRCEEANVLDAHRAALREPTDACTVVTDMITGRPARYVKNKLIEDLLASGLRSVEFPAQLSLTAPLGNTGDGNLPPCLPDNPQRLPATRPPAHWSILLRKRRQSACAPSRVPSPLPISSSASRSRS